MRAVGSGFISVLRPSERLSVLRGVLRCATLRWRRGWGSVVAGGPSEYCDRCRDTERVWRRCAGLRCRAAWKGRSLHSSAAGLWTSAAPASQGVRVLVWVDGCMDGWKGQVSLWQREKWPHTSKERWKHLSWKLNGRWRWCSCLYSMCKPLNLQFFLLILILKS